RLGADDQVLALVDTTSGDDLITVTENGFGKRTAIEQYPRKGRPTKGVVVHKLTKRTGGLSGAFVGSKDQDMFVISSSGIVIRVQPSQIRRVGRASQGVRTMRVEEGARVVALAPVVMQAQAEEAAPADASSEVDDDVEPAVSSQKKAVAKKATTAKKTVTKKSTAK